jgi:hypothetical protein
MARRTATVTIVEAGRDLGKVFILTEMSATQAEKWATRMLLAIGQSGVEIPDNLAAAGIAGLAVVSLRAFAGVPWHLAEPLLDEMFGCVAFQPDPARPMVVRALIEDDIEEIATRVRLREEIVSLHLGFSIAAYTSKLKAAMTTTAEPISDTPTSPAASA